LRLVIAGDVALTDCAAARRPNWPLVAMITAVPEKAITPLKIRNFTVFDAGTTSLESWLIAASKLAWKIATSSTLKPVLL
jgi:hypothetical protein